MKLIWPHNPLLIKVYKMQGRKRWSGWRTRRELLLVFAGSQGTSPRRGQFDRSVVKEEVARTKRGILLLPQRRTEMINILKQYFPLKITILYRILWLTKHYILNLLHMPINDRGFKNIVYFSSSNNLQTFTNL